MKNQLFFSIGLGLFIVSASSVAMQQGKKVSVSAQTAPIAAAYKGLAASETQQDTASASLQPRKIIFKCKDGVCTLKSAASETKQGTASPSPQPRKIVFKCKDGICALRSADSAAQQDTESTSPKPRKIEFKCKDGICRLHKESHDSQEGK